MYSIGLLGGQGPSGSSLILGPEQQHSRTYSCLFPYLNNTYRPSPLLGRKETGSGRIVCSRPLQWGLKLWRHDAALEGRGG